jgi:hypothetical protein
VSDPHTWSVAQVLEWVQTENLLDDEDLPKFLVQKIDGRALQLMTVEDFRSYGIPGGPSVLLYQGVRSLFPNHFQGVPCAMPFFVEQLE